MTTPAGSYVSGQDVRVSADLTVTAQADITLTYGPVGTAGTAVPGADLIASGTTYSYLIDTSGQTERLVCWAYEFVTTDGDAQTGSFLVTALPFAAGGAQAITFDGGNATTTAFDLVLDGGSS